MGLPIAKALVAAQGGTMSVTSQTGHGSVFSFTLPVDHPTAAGTPDRAQARVLSGSDRSREEAS
jgi:signal transduction histidine kinase